MGGGGSDAREAARAAREKEGEDEDEDEEEENPLLDDDEDILPELIAARRHLCASPREGKVPKLEVPPQREALQRTFGAHFSAHARHLLA
jgi:hypothetical protein